MAGGWMDAKKENMRMGMYTKASRMGRPEFESQLRQVLVLQTRARNSLCESLRFLVCEMGVIIPT